jgi:predicted ester cyclase
MTNLKNIIAGATIALATTATATFADNMATVQKFYDLLSNPGSASHVQAMKTATAANWESIADYSGKTKSIDTFLRQMGGFSKLIPDLNWAVEDMIETNDTVVVRSRATGTPVAPFFGVDGQGRSFDILTIDIHHMENGVIAKTYHVEDWAGALQQLKGK